MNSESKLLTEIWSSVEDQLPKGMRVEVAMAMFRAFDEYGIETIEFEEAAEEDNYLHVAFKALVDDEVEYERDDDEE